MCEPFCRSSLFQKYSKKKYFHCNFEISKSLIEIYQTVFDKFYMSNIFYEMCALLMWYSENGILVFENAFHIYMDALKCFIVENKHKQIALFSLSHCVLLNSVINDIWLILFKTLILLTRVFTVWKSYIYLNTINFQTY